jgi:prophage regulatory protein
MQITRLIGWPELRACGIRWSRQYILKQEKAGNFPPRVRLGPNSVAWRFDEIQEWLAARSDARDRETAAPRGWQKKQLVEAEAER